jgi:hypothetical protein
MGYFLNSGNLSSTEGCSIGDYRIDWHLGSTSGDIVFVSGNVGNTDEDIEAVHPLVDEIVIGGTLYPVIKYVYVSGIKYSPYVEEGSLHSPDLLECLPPKVVDVIECGSTLDANSIYDWRYTRNVNVGEKSRQFKFNLDGVSNYIAWAFTALQIVDRLNIYYCTASDIEGEIIDAFIIGANTTNDYAPTNYPRQPGYNPNIAIDPIRVATSTQVRYISDVSSFSYQAGDWLRFEIEGNVLNPLQDDTKWTLEIKCIEVIDESNNFDDIGKYDATSFDIDVDEDGCTYTFSYNNIDSLSSVANGPSIFLRKYLYFNSASVTHIAATGASNSIGYAGSVETFNRIFNYTIALPQIRLTPITNPTLCASLDGVMTIQKSGTSLVLNFTSLTDYNRVVNNISTIQAHERYTAYLASNNTQSQYYGYYEFIIRVAIGGCDESHTTKRYYIHFSSAITYGTYSITFSLVNLTVNYPNSGITCDSSYNTVVSAVNLINTTTSGANETLVTDVRFAGPYDGLPEAHNFSNDTILQGPDEYEISRVFRIPKIMINSLFNAYAYGFCDIVGPGGFYYGIYLYYDYITIADILSVLTTYKFERKRFLETLVCTDTMYDQVEP